MNRKFSIYLFSLLAIFFVVTPITAEAQSQADKKPIIEASFQFLHLIKKNMGKDRKKINGKRLIGGNENEANNPDIKNI